MKIMAIDLGDRRTGVAFSDATNTLAGRAYTIDEYNREALAQKIASEAEKEGVTLILLGLPLNMNFTEGDSAAKSREFKALLEQKCGIEVKLCDERGTSVSANRMLSDAGKKKKRQRALVDAVAATIILQSYLDSL